MDTLRDTLRSLRAHAMRFSLTSLGILWGAFVLTYLSATMEGIDQHFTRELEETGPKVLIAWPGSIPKERLADRGARPLKLEVEDVERLQEIQLVEGATPDLSLWNQIVRTGRRTKLLHVGGVSAITREIRNFEVRDLKSLALRAAQLVRRSNALSRSIETCLHSSFGWLFYHLSMS